MKHRLPLLAAAIGVLTAAYASDPVVTTSFTPDPAPYVHGDTVYLFTGHDEDDAQYFKMKDWQLFSTTDMLNWTYRGTPISTATFGWAEQGDNAWAAQAVERNGKWYWYICAGDTARRGLHSIGVAVAPAPEGPYTDPLGEPLVPGTTLGFIDPSVFIDNDGQAWLFWGNNGMWYAPLADDMISLAGEVREVAGLNDPAAFGPMREKRDYATNTMMMKTNYEEGPWVFRRGDTYYIVYAAGGVPEHMAYSYASDIHGPWTYGGRIIDESPASFTIHGGSIEFKGRHFMFYHNGLAPNGGGFRRATTVEEFSWQGDSLPFIPHTRGALAKGTGTLDPYSRVEAETMAGCYGLKTDRRAGSDHYITSVHNGDWLRLRDVDFGEELPAGASMSVIFSAVKEGGCVEFYLDRPGGTLLARVEAPAGAEAGLVGTGDAKAGVSGIHDVYLLFRGGDSELFDVDAWQLHRPL
ncbi:MAG: family 43 glycosylhydrolase [Muribaculaceae bacterium]|nr:family 43 glycosylhydrolase [Muribaculaceae bacterium]